MYTDFRFCKYCSDNGYYVDGENYCSQCKQYLCFKCSRTHGQTCQQPDQQTSNNTETSTAKVNYNTRTNNINTLFETRNSIRGTSNIDNASNNVTSKQFVQVSRTGSCQSTSGHTNRSQETLSSQSSAVDRNTWTNHSEVNRTAKASRPQFKQDQNKPNDVIGIANNGKRQHFSNNGGVIRIMKAWPDVKPSNFEGQMILACPCHPEMSVENLCINHNALCCIDCMNTQHNQCDFQPIDEIAHSMNSENELQKMNSRVDELNNLCDSVLYKLQLCIQNLNSRVLVSGVSALQMTKPDFNQSNLRVNTERNISACKDIQQQISLCRQDLTNAATSNNKIRLFIALHKTKTTIENLHRNIQAIASQGTQVGVHNDTFTAKSVVKSDFKNNPERPAILSTNQSPSASVNTCVKPDTKEKLFEKSTKTMDNPRQTSFVIGDVILSPCEDPEAHVNTGQDQQDSKCDFYSSDDDVDIVLNNNTTEIAKPKQAQQKSTEFFNKDVKSRTHSKDRIKTHGLATDYYLKQISNGTNDDDDILRLYSPIPEESCHLFSEKRYSNLRENSSTTEIKDSKLEHKETNQNHSMIKWQDKKLLESVEHRKENDLKETTTRSVCQGRPKKIFESSESELQLAISRNNCDKQKKMRRLYKARQENANVNKVTAKQKKVHKVKHTTSPTVKYSIETDASRLQKWIKQTEEMNKIYHQSQVSKVLHGKDEYQLGSYDVLEANGTNLEGSEINDSQLPPFMELKLKNARLMNNTRVSSAKSQASDSDESKHKKQMFVHRPKYDLSLCAEYGVRLPSDRLKCHINGISCLPDGRIVVTDYNNKNIKLFRLGWSKPSKLQLEEPPHDVTSVSHTLMAAIAGLAFDRMYLISVGQCMAVKKRFKTGCECKAVTSYESNIYLLCLFRYKTEVRVLNTDGVVSMRLAFGHSIPSPVDITINQSDGTIFITDRTNGVYKCSSVGIQSRSFDSNIEVYQKVTCDSNNNVFVSSQCPCGINELSKDGKHLMPVVPNAGMLGVNALAYNEISDCLVAGCNKTQTVRIYSIRDCL